MIHAINNIITVTRAQWGGHSVVVGRVVNHVDQKLNHIRVSRHGDRECDLYIWNSASLRVAKCRCGTQIIQLVLQFFWFNFPSAIGGFAGVAAYPLHRFFIQCEQYMTSCCSFIRQK